MDYRQNLQGLLAMLLAANLDLGHLSVENWLELIILQYLSAPDYYEGLAENPVCAVIDDIQRKFDGMEEDEINSRDELSAEDHADYWSDTWIFQKLN